MTSFVMIASNKIMRSDTKLNYYIEVDLAISYKTDKASSKIILSNQFDLNLYTELI